MNEDTAYFWHSAIVGLNTACICVFECVKAQGNVGWRAGWLAAWWLSLLLSVLNVIFPLAAQGPSVCWARCSLCGDQRDPQNSQRAEEMTPPDLTQLSRVCWTSMRPLRTRQTGPDGTRLSRVVHHCLSFDKSCYCVAPRFSSTVCSVHGSYEHWLGGGYITDSDIPGHKIFSLSLSTSWFLELSKMVFF